MSGSVIPLISSAVLGSVSQIFGGSAPLRFLFGIESGSGRLRYQVREEWCVRVAGGGRDLGERMMFTFA